MTVTNQIGDEKVSSSLEVVGAIPKVGLPKTSQLNKLTKNSIGRERNSRIYEIACLTKNTRRT